METKKPENLIIATEIVEAIGNYLISKPYGEVYQLIKALESLQPLEDNRQKEPTGE